MSDECYRALEKHEISFASQDCGGPTWTISCLEHGPNVHGASMVSIVKSRPMKWVLGRLNAFALLPRGIERPTPSLLSNEAFPNARDKLEKRKTCLRGLGGTLHHVS